MNLKIGIVGLPNAGKSTLFNALLKKTVADMAPYPFCTIEPNVGIVPVPDDRLGKLAEVVRLEEGVLPPVVPAVIEFVDIAGLVKGAAQGQGLGNKFLSHIREVNIIVHVVRAFTDSSVVHVMDTIDPKRDISVIDTELILADLDTLNKQSEPRGVRDKDVQKRWSLISLLKTELNSGRRARDVITNPEDMQIIRDLHLLTMKPVLFVFNISEAQLTDMSSFNGFLPGGMDLIPISAKTESELAALTPDEQQTYLSSLGLNASGLDRVIQKSYAMLGLISFLTCGVKEARAWTIPAGIIAQEAAGVIHTDFSKKFIKADIVKYDDFVALGGWKNARENGRVHQEGRSYQMQDGDVVEFKIGA